MVDAPPVPPQRNIAVPKSLVAVGPIFGSMSATVEVEAQRKLVKRYRDLEAIWTNESMFPATAQNAHENPLEPKKGDPWPELMKSRYEYADSDSVLGREFLVIALYSPAFRKSIAFDNYYQWEALRKLLYINRFSIRMFARTRRIPYVQHYVKSKLRQRFGDLPLDPITEEQLREARHPHETYYDFGRPC
jgi:hypothetical protein